MWYYISHLQTSVIIFLKVQLLGSQSVGFNILIEQCMDLMFPSNKMIASKESFRYMVIIIIITRVPSWKSLMEIPKPINQKLVILLEWPNYILCLKYTLRTMMK